MIGTVWQKAVLAARREHRDMKKAGYEQVNEQGGLLWELNRGKRLGHKIVDVKIDYSGTGLWIKVEKP